MPLPLVPILGAAGLGLLAYKVYDDEHPELQSMKHVDPASGVPVQVIVPTRAPKPRLSVTDVPIAGANARVILSSGTGARYVPPTVVKRSQVPGRLDLLPTVITPTGASSLAVMTLTDAQNALNTLGYGPIQVDGRLGPATQAATKNYQAKNGLPVDGSPGPATKASMQDALANLAGVGSALGAHPAVVAATTSTPAQVAARVTGNLAGQLVGQSKDASRVLSTAVAVADTANQVSRDAAKVFSLFNFGAVDADPRFDPLYASIGPDQGVATDYAPTSRPTVRTRQAKSTTTMTEAQARRSVKRYHVETLSDVQVALNRLGASPELDDSGTLDAQTVAAVKVFQVTHGLLADGVPGPKTRTALTLALLASGQRSDFGLTLFTLFGADPPPVGSLFGAAMRRPAVSAPRRVSAPRVSAPRISAPTGGGRVASPSGATRPFITAPTGGGPGSTLAPGVGSRPYIAPPTGGGPGSAPGLPSGLVPPPPPTLDGKHRHHHKRDDDQQPQAPPPDASGGGGAPPPAGGGDSGGGGGGDSGGGVSQAPDPSGGSYDDGSGGGGSYDDGGSDDGGGDDSGGDDSGGGVGDVSSIMSGFGGFG